MKQVPKRQKENGLLRNGKRKSRKVYFSYLTVRGKKKTTSYNTAIYLKRTKSNECLRYGRENTGGLNNLFALAFKKKFNSWPNILTHDQALKEF